MDVFLYLLKFLRFRTRAITKILKICLSRLFHFIPHQKAYGIYRERSLPKMRYIVLHWILIQFKSVVRYKHNRWLEKLCEYIWAGALTFAHLFYYNSALYGFLYMPSCYNCTMKKLAFWSAAFGKILVFYFLFIQNTRKSKTTNLNNWGGNQNYEC